MRELRATDLVAITSRVLGGGVDEALATTDLELAESVLDEAAAGTTPEIVASRILHGLVVRRPLRRANGEVAFLAALQFLNMNGLDLAIDPAEDAMSAIAGATSGTMGVEQLEAWIAERTIPLTRGTKETTMKKLGVFALAAALAATVALLTLDHVAKGNRIAALNRQVSTLQHRVESVRKNILALRKDTLSLRKKTIDLQVQRLAQQALHDANRFSRALGHNLSLKALLSFSP